MIFGEMKELNSQYCEKSYHDNGQLGEKRSYKDGKLHGPYESYYDNGQLGSKVTYRNGKLV